MDWLTNPLAKPDIWIGAILSVLIAGLVGVVGKFFEKPINTFMTHRTKIQAQKRAKHDKTIQEIVDWFAVRDTGLSEIKTTLVLAQVRTFGHGILLLFWLIFYSLIDLHPNLTEWFLYLALSFGLGLLTYFEYHRLQRVTAIHALLLERLGFKHDI